LKNQQNNYQAQPHKKNILQWKSKPWEKDLTGWEEPIQSFKALPVALLTEEAGHPSILPKYSKKNITFFMNVGCKGDTWSHWYSLVGLEGARIKSDQCFFLFLILFFFNTSFVSSLLFSLIFFFSPNLNSYSLYLCNWFWK